MSEQKLELTPLKFEVEENVKRTIFDKEELIRFLNPQPKTH
jgi:hypothetical protein